ncbi:UDP-4-amino-4,6-dideoxy-N-acetyl-beta-L-altrosamine N-acetyltransferase [Acetivibrio straminisolvens]|uniref:Acetyltransferase n=1 Tax=Acetivibrio straminisolvens JCM 21531 TaxID=1294263 RepID=W4V3M1_9FIRM|nr:UDP-4-amino-4,6-dideoxy-N-acetyl-beta-L-altrosamine N-acetyltransferase [Acetivibrio straminisolvens]GAE87801.1 acetyltransferase [Acetivibrio straminisolvens JCM 21531]
MDNDKLKDGYVNYINILELDNIYIDKLRNWRNQDFVRKRMFNQEIITEKEHARFIEHLRNNSEKSYYICFLGSRPFGVLCYDFYKKNNNLEFGYYLVEQEFINSGLGIVMEYSLLNHAFYDLKVNKVFCRTMSSNEKVVHLHTNFGFVTEGILKQHVKINDSYEDITLQAITESIWAQNKVKIEKYMRVIVDIDKISPITGRC